MMPSPQLSHPRADGALRQGVEKRWVNSVAQ